MGRNKLLISAEQVLKLSALGASQEEIADFFGCERTTISKRFSEEIQKGRSGLKIKLRRLQLRAAERGSVPMLIFLGKALLGQTDKPSQEDLERIKVLIDC